MLTAAESNKSARACVRAAGDASHEVLDPRGRLNLAALTNPAPASTELPDDDFDPTGGALTRDDDGDASDGDGFSDDDDDALDRDDGVFRPTEDDEKASGKGGRLRMRGGLSLDELGAEYQNSARRARPWRTPGPARATTTRRGRRRRRRRRRWHGGAGRGRPRANGTRGRR